MKTCVVYSHPLFDWRNNLYINFIDNLVNCFLDKYVSMNFMYKLFDTKDKI